MNLKYIFKIIDINEWQKVREIGTYSGSSNDIEDGFIHLGFPNSTLDIDEWIYENLNFHNAKRFFSINSIVNEQHFRVLLGEPQRGKDPEKEKKRILKALRGRQMKQ